MFWKFYLTIWLTMAASVVALFAITRLFQIEPFPQEVELAKHDFASAVVTQLLADGKHDAAAAFSKVAQKELPASRMQTAPDPSAHDYVVDVGTLTTSLVDVIWPRLVPWVAIALAAALSAYWLTRNLVRPIALIRNGLSTLAHGKFEIRISKAMVGRRDEIAELATDFDPTATRLEEFRLSQRRLFSDVSHELRSPLSRLQASLGVTEQNPAKQSPMIDRMAREIERMDGLIGEILTLARLADRPSTGIERQTVDLTDLLQEIVIDAAFEAQARAVRIELRGPEHFIAKVNGELIYRAFENVIRNAVKYTAQGLLVSVEADIQVEVLLVAVID